MKKGLLAAFICLFAELVYSQSRTLLYTSNGWIQLNVPSGQMPDNRPPTYIDDVIFSRARSGDSIYHLAIPLGTALKIGGDTSSFCKKIYAMGMEINFMPDDGLNDEGAPVEVYANTGGLLSLDSGAVLREGKVHVFGDGGGLGGLQVRNSKFGVYERHNSAWANVYLEDGGKARFINSSFTGYDFETVQKSTGVYATGVGLYADRSTFAVTRFILGDNSVDTFLNSKIGQADNIIGLNFLIGKNSSFISESDTITLPIPCPFSFITSGSVFKGNVDAWYINFDQEDPANPLSNIIDGNLLLHEEPGSGISGDVKISGNFTNQMPYIGFSDKPKVLVNNEEVFEIGGIRNFGASTSISDCAENYCHYKMEFFGDKNSNIDWNIGFPIDTLVINKTGCAKVSSKNPLYVAGETRIKSGQLALDPIDTIPYKLVCAGNVNISPGGGLFLRRNAKGNVANIAIGGTLVDNNTGTPDSTCAGLSNPYNGRIDYYNDTTSTGNPDTTNTDTGQIAHTDSLSNFSGSYSDNTVFLNWSVKKQVSTKSFSVEKSFDNSAFLSVSNVIATTNDPNENKYSSTDNSTLKKINYYRIKVFDNQDNYYYSDTIAVAGPEEIEIRLYPNPAKDIIHLSLPDAGIHTEIKVVDMKGVVIKKLKIDAGAADVPIDISQLQRGAYTIFISTGQTKKTLRFIKE